MHRLFNPAFLIFLLLIILAVVWMGGPKEKLNGIIWTHKTHVPVEDASVTLLSPEGRLLDSTLTDAAGKFHFSVKEFNECQLHIEKDGYQSRTVDITAEMNSSSSNLVRIEIHSLTAPSTLSE